MPFSQNNELRWLASRVRPFLRLHFGSYGFIVISSVLVKSPLP